MTSTTAMRFVIAATIWWRIKERSIGRGSMNGENYINLRGGEVEKTLVRTVMDSLESEERMLFLMHQILITAQAIHKDPADFVNACVNSKKGLAFRLPPEFARQVIRMAGAQSVIDKESMITMLLANFCVIGLQAFASTLDGNEAFMRMHKDVAIRLKEMFDDTGIQGEED